MEPLDEIYLEMPEDRAFPDNEVLADLPSVEGIRRYGSSRGMVRTIRYGKVIPAGDERRKDPKSNPNHNSTKQRLLYRQGRLEARSNGI